MVEERRPMLICEFCDAKVSPYPEPDCCPHCHKPITEVVPASKLKEQEERCERLEEALREIDSPVLPYHSKAREIARTALEHSPGDEGDS